MRNIHLNYAEEKYDACGALTEFKLKVPETFNFGYDVVDEIAERDPQRRAMVWCNQAGDARVFTFADMKQYSDRTANYLRSLGIGKGDMVLAVLRRHYQFWFIATALHKLGAVLVPVTDLLAKQDVADRVNAASVKMVICTAQGEVAAAVEAAAADCPTLEKKVIVNGARPGWHSFDEEMVKASETFVRVETRTKEPMLLFFSSGTAGEPKLVLHDHAYALSHLLTAKHWHCVEPDGLHFTIADTGWGKSFWGKFYGQWLMEAAVFTYDFDAFVPSEILSLIEKYRITTLCCPPAIYRLLLREDASKCDLSSLVHTTVSGEAMSPDVFYKWKKLTGLSLMEGFGQTETALLVCNLKNSVPKPGSMGKASPQFRVELIDEEGQSCPPGVTGEIVAATDPKPAGLLSCYYRDEKRTQEAFRGGWYHTGDNAWRDEDGYFWYVGRSEDIINASGYRISPFEIESVLSEHPAVAECAVTGVPDEARGQMVKATVVLMKTYEPSEDLMRELQELVKQHTAPYKYPRVVDFASVLPRTADGKIRRAEIREKDEGK